jgi:hypothetical protein
MHIAALFTNYQKLETTCLKKKKKLRHIRSPTICLPFNLSQEATKKYALST